jgi:hypothetical protein
MEIIAKTAKTLTLEKQYVVELASEKKVSLS